MKIPSLDDTEQVNTTTIGGLTQGVHRCHNALVGVRTYIK